MRSFFVRQTLDCYPYSHYDECMNQTIGFIGLGHMGKNMVLRLVEGGIDVIAYNRTKEKTDELLKEQPKVKPAYTVRDLIQQLPIPRVIWLMIPNGKPVDEILQQLMSFGIQKGDIIIDGGNTYYKDTVRRSSEFAKQGITLVDCGVSGGLTGARNGASLMLGGDEQVIKQLDWLWKSLAVSDGYKYFGPSGAGHFVKMVHNGVEYGIDEALGEGFEILASGPYKLDLGGVAKVWAHGSVVRGWLVELLAKALEGDPMLDRLAGRVGGGETGKWALESAKEHNVAAPIIELSLATRKKSLTNPTFTGKVISALRAGYGGHEEPK